MQRKRVKELLNTDEQFAGIKLQGWVRSKRESKTFSFLEVNDGSCLKKNLQVIADEGIESYSELKKNINTGASVEIEGDLVESPGKGQKWELKATSVKMVGFADPDSYPLQKKTSHRRISQADRSPSTQKQ